MNAFRTLVNGLSRMMGLLACMCIVVITVAMLAEVFYRYVLGRSFLGVIELVELLMAFIFFALLSNTQYLKGHLRLNLFTGRLPQRMAVVLETFVLLIVMVFLGIVAWQAWIDSIDSTVTNQIRFGAIEFPVWPGKIAASVGLSIMVLQLLVDFFERLGAAFAGRAPIAEMGKSTAESDGV
jgi:TRAP-type C4-dicarboxylate transport system permease small subunit